MYTHHAHYNTHIMIHTSYTKNNHIIYTSTSQHTHIILSCASVDYPIYTDQNLSGLQSGYVCLE